MTELHRRAELQRQFILTQDNNLLKQISEIEKDMAEKPKNYDLRDKNNVLTDIDLQFQKECASLEHAGVKDPKKLTVFEFNAKRDFFESLVKKK